MEQIGTRPRPEIRATTCEPLAETRPKCIPAKEPGLEGRLTLLIRRIKCRAIPKWARVTLKWEGNIRKWEAEVIALSPAADSSKARKRKANTDRGSWKV